MFLEPGELQKLTGYKTCSAQRRALNAMGITHKVNAAGDVIVLIAHVNKLLDGDFNVAKTTKTPQLDLSIFNG